MRSLGYVPSEERMPGILVILTSFPEARFWTPCRGCAVLKPPLLCRNRCGAMKDGYFFGFESGRYRRPRESPVMVSSEEQGG